MAFLMSFTKQGVASPDGYWKLTQSNIDHLSKTGLVVFAGYHTQEAREADARGNALATHAVLVTPELYAGFIAEAADIRAQCYALARAALEGPAPVEGQPDTRTSYFAAATDC